MSTLKDKLRTVEDDLSNLRAERATKAAARDDLRNKFAEAPGYDVNSNEYKAAHEAVKSVGEVDDKINEVQSAQIGILKMLGQQDVTAAPGSVNESFERGVEGDLTIKALVESDAFRAVSKSANSTARFGSVGIGELPIDYALKADIGATAPMRADSFAGVQGPLPGPISVLDLVSIGSTDGNSVPYAVFNPTSAAAVQVEGSSKQLGAATFTDASATIDTVAAYYKVLKQTLADAGVIQSILENQLRYDVRVALEKAVVNKILATSGIGTTAYAAGPIADQVSHSILDVQLANLQPDGVAMHPSDWESVRLSREGSGTGQYLFGPPSQAGASTIFGVPVVPTTAVAAGLPLVGNFRAGATLFVRSNMEVLISDSDGTDFIQNRVTILGEMRAGTAVWRPLAFSTVDLTP